MTRGVWTSDLRWEGHGDLPRELKFSQKDGFESSFRVVPSVDASVDAGGRQAPPAPQAPVRSMLQQNAPGNTFRNKVPGNKAVISNNVNNSTNSNNSNNINNINNSGGSKFSYRPNSREKTGEMVDSSIRTSGSGVVSQPVSQPVTALSMTQSSGRKASNFLKAGSGSTSVGKAVIRGGIRVFI